MFGNTIPAQVATELSIHVDSADIVQFVFTVNSETMVWVLGSVGSNKRVWVKGCNKNVTDLRRETLSRTATVWFPPNRTVGSDTEFQTIHNLSALSHCVKNSETGQFGLCSCPVTRLITGVALYPEDSCERETHPLIHEHVKTSLSITFTHYRWQQVHLCNDI